MFAAIKGWLGEKITQLGMWSGLSATLYRRVHNLIIPCDGGTTQIDHILVSIYGVFVIETKNMRGWIFGSEQSPQWTQSIFGKKFRFQNPLHQNDRHTRALARHLDIPEEVVHSVVFFIGDCKFKTAMPANVLSHGLCRYIRSFRREVLPQEEVARVHALLRTAKDFPAASHALHIEHLHQRHSGDQCPKCGANLILRTVHKGPRAGGPFYGCAGFPKCRHTRSV